MILKQIKTMNEKKLVTIYESNDGGKTYTSRPMRDKLSHNSSNNSEAKLPNHMTSIEWYNKKIATYESFLETKQITWKEYYIAKDKLLKQAKEMHKQEIIEARQDGIYRAINGYGISNDEYYQETFKKD